MNWKKYKQLPPGQKRADNYYIIGLDLGNDSSGIAFYNLHTNTPEAIDLSGGYGKPSIPTAMQYIADTKEWVFGEYAILNHGEGTEITISALMERLGNFDHIDVAGRSLSVAGVLSLFIKELVGNVYNINPRAEIVGICAAVPAYFSEQAQEELRRAFAQAGYEKEFIGLVTDRECALSHYVAAHEAVKERVLLLDFGARELRGGLYNIQTDGNETTITSLSSVFSEDISTAKTNGLIAKFFEDFVRKEVGKTKPLTTKLAHQIHQHILAFSYQHRDMLFHMRGGQIKVYFNFVYPPFQQTITMEEVEYLLKPYVRRFENFIKDVFEKSISKGLSPKDIDRVLCVGGGFEMLWAKDAAAKLFPHVDFYKNPKMVICEGAAIMAANALGLSDANITLTDNHQLSFDIGLSDGRNFFPLVERNAFWWQSHLPRFVLVNQEVNGELGLKLCKRTKEGEISGLANMVLRGLPVRPKGTTRLEVKLNFVSDADFIVNVRDTGFGEMFPESGFERSVEVKMQRLY